MLPLSSRTTTANVTLPLKYSTEIPPLPITFYGHIDYTAK